MKKLLSIVLFLMVLSSFAGALPVDQVRLTGYVNDYTSTLSPNEVQQISSIAQSLQEQGKAEIAVVIVDDFDGLTREEYAITIAHENLGDTQTDNGLLILIGMDVREYRIEVGYGLEGDLNDAKVGRMGRELLVPNFQAGNYGQGIVELVQAIGFELMPEGIPAPQGYTGEDESSSGFTLWILFIVIFFIIRAISYAQYKNKHYKRPGSDDVDDAFAAGMIASWFFRPPRGGGGFGGSGGFGGFGGGGFGGGGSGGGW